MSTATETGEGRAPSSPLQLSWREWLDVFKRTGKQFMADDCMGLGQQVAFSSLFAFLPTVILLIGLLGLFGYRRLRLARAVRRLGRAARRDST